MKKRIIKLVITAIVMWWGIISITSAANVNVLEVQWKNSSKGYLLYSVNGELEVPCYYYMDINDYPCDTKECYRMEVRIYWDMWGNFLKVGLKEGVDLTKINHQPFTNKDYEHLHELLNNPNAGIQYYKLDELTAKKSEAHYYSVDAVSGATVQDVSYECVRGAVKTCYTLWKIVHGDVVAAIKNNTVNCCKEIQYNKSDEGQKEFVIFNELTTKLIQHDSVSVDFLNLLLKTSYSIPSVMYSCILELMRRSSIYDKDLYNWLADSFISVDEEEQELAIYNFLNQNKFKTKEVKKYLVSRGFF